MVGHHQELALDALEVGNAVVGEIVDGVFKTPVDGLAHDDLLELVYAADAPESFGEETRPLLREEEFGDDRNGRMPGDVSQSLDCLLITVRAYIFENLIILHVMLQTGAQS